MNDRLELKKLEMQQEILEKKQEIQKAKYPNSMENIKSRIDEGSKASMLGLGSFLCFDMGFLCLLGITQSIGLAIAAPVLGIAGIKLLKETLKANKNNNKYMNYISAIVVQGERSIVKIANDLHVDYDTALKDIVFIISNDYIKGFRINKETRMLECNRETSRIKESEVDTINDNNNNTNNTNSNNYNSRCPACGGSRTIRKNDELYCKYCGTRL